MYDSIESYLLLNISIYDLVFTLLLGNDCAGRVTRRGHGSHVGHEAYRNSLAGCGSLPLLPACTKPALFR